LIHPNQEADRLRRPRPLTHVNNLGIIKTVGAATSEIIHIGPESVIHIVGIRNTHKT
jgi:hypothetical protein